MGCCIIVFIPYVAWVIGFSHRDPSREEIDGAEFTVKIRTTIIGLVFTILTSTT